MQSWEYPQIPALRRKHLGITILMYKDASAVVKEAESATGRFPAGMGYDWVAAEHPSWFLRDRTGQIIEWSDWRGDNWKTTLAAWTPYVSGRENEHVTNWPGQDGRFSGADWRWKLDAARWLAARKVPLLAVIYGPTADRVGQTYHRATWLLSWNGRTGASAYVPDALVPPRPGRTPRTDHRHDQDPLTTVALALVDRAKPNFLETGCNPRGRSGLVVRVTEWSSDKEIGMGYQARDGSAADGEFEAFFDTHRRLYWRIAFTIVGNPAVADDVTQETFSAIYARWDRIQRTTVEAYCRTMLVNASLSAVRKRKREHLTEAPELIPRPVGTGVIDPSGAQDIQLDLAALLRDLRPGYRAVIALRYLDDLPVAEVAKILGISEGTVKSQSARALALMRKQLTDCEDDPVFVSRTS